MIEDTEKVEKALRLALRELRMELRWMIETSMQASLSRQPNVEYADASELTMIHDCLEAIRACLDALQGVPVDEHPDWLNSVINGEIEIPSVPSRATVNGEGGS